jgi:RNA polymerase sigma-70 factor (ECF subfamily)
MQMQGTSSQQLEALYRRYGPSLHRRARMLTRDSEEATDIMQDAFVNYMNMREPLRGDASPFTILYQIVTHRAVDRLRRRARWTGRLMLREDEEPEAPERRLDSAMVYEGELSRVEAAQDLALLTQGEEPQVLTAAFLYFVEGHSAEQVGQVLNLSRQAVMKMLQQFLKRARARRTRLEGDEAP